MSVKRQATSELNHDNWDQEDPSEHEEMGSFRSAAKDILEKRVIRTAKRRSHISGDDNKKNVFSGFGGFNKTQPTSFDFLSKLTNGSQATNGIVSKSDTPTSTALFASTPVSSSSGMFSTLAAGKSTFTTQSMFGSNTSPVSSKFTESKTESRAEDSSFKNKPLEFNTSTSPKNNTESLAPSSVFGGLISSGKSPFTSTTSTSSTFKPSAVSSVTASAGRNTSLKVEAGESETDDKKLNYYSKLKGLNESVSEWIKKHVENTPLCILSPIFKDYEKYLKEIQDEYHGSKVDNSSKAENNSNPLKSNENNIVINSCTFTSSKIKNVETVEPAGSIFGNKTAPQANFSFGIKPPSNPTITSTGLTLSANTSPIAPFSFAPSTTTSTASNGTAPFSFGINKPFTFNSNIEHKTEANENNPEDDEEPPKVDFTPIKEDNSVYEKHCKIFFKKDANFVDKGLGTLYVKKIEETGKHQLLVRANTSLGNVLLNLILSSSIPTQRLGKNNVMMVCIPTPESKPPPTPVLIRVKTSEEADNLLSTLNKFKE